MTTNVVQVRMPSVLLKNIEELVRKGFYRNTKHFEGRTDIPVRTPEDFLVQK